MSEYLTKIFSSELYQPDSYEQWVEGYTYFVEGAGEPSLDLLKQSGYGYIESYMNANGYVVALNPEGIQQFIVLNSDGTNYTPAGAFPFGPPYLGEGRFAHFTAGAFFTGGGVGYPDPFLIPEIYFNVPPSGELINVPGHFETIIPEPEYRDVPVIGWNGGAYSAESFSDAGEAEFSVIPYSSGAFVGLCDAADAVLDAHWNKITYAFFCENGQYSIYINGVDINRPKIGFIISDVFKIVITKENVFFYVNGVIKHSTLKVDPDTSTYKLDNSLYFSGDSITNASITSISYANIALEYTYSVGILSEGLSLLEFGYTNSVSIGVEPKVAVTYSYGLRILGQGASLIEFNYSNEISILIANNLSVEYLNSMRLYQYGIASIEFSYGYKVKMTSGSIIPAQPALISFNYKYAIHIRDPQFIPPTTSIRT